MPTFDSPVARQHLPGVAGLPTVWLLDSSGAVVRKLERVTPQALQQALDALLPPAE